GPYKFGGLPGLIVRVEDSHSEHIFQLYKISKIPRTMLYVEVDKIIMASTDEVPKTFTSNIQNKCKELAGGKVNSNQDMNFRLVKHIATYNNYIEKY
ncbi:hypothetical protein OAT16_05440, partial [Prolixibacteraceae bacterium]|nr:hypothetical protein [Prolixibacteraceae bacterium]